MERSPDIRAVETAAFRDGDAHRLQIVDGDRLIVVDVRCRVVGCRVIAFKQRVVRIDVAVWRKAGHRRDSGHAGHFVEPIHQSIEERDAGLRLRVCRARQHETERRQPLAIETRVRRHQLLKAAEQ